MRLNIGSRIDTRLREEKALLAAGEIPRPRLEHKLQRKALRLLAGFLALMLLFTVLSRAASAVATAVVEADTAKSGVLTDRATINGQIEAADDEYFTLPTGLRVESVLVKAGQQVEKGAPLLVLDPDEVRAKLAALDCDIATLKLKIAAALRGATGESAEAVIAAQQALDDAKIDYERLVASLDRGEGRTQEDFADTQAALDKALVDYEKAVRKTQDDLIEAAEDDLKAARENLETVQESANDALRSAQQAVDQAADNPAKDAYFQALSAYNRASAALEQAKQNLANLEAAAEPDADAIAAARDALAAAQEAADAARDTLDGSSYSDSGYDIARENLSAAKASWKKKVEKAEDAVAEAEDELRIVKARTDFSDEAAVIAAQGVLDAAERALREADRGREDGVFSREEQLYKAEKAIEAAQRALDTAERQATEQSRSDSIAYAEAQVDRLGYQNDLTKLEAQRSLLAEAAGNDGQIMAPVSGTVLSTLEKGSKTQEGSDTVTISSSEGGHVFTGTLEKKAATKLATGDKGQLSYTHEGKAKQLEVQITAIGTPTEEGLCIITAKLPTGSFPTGVSAELTITRKSETHHSCLPLSALRSGSEGDFVLVLREKKTVMGIEWTVVKVPVTVKDRDSELMSVESTLMWDDRVVTTSSKPIAEGDRVRLESES